METARNTLFEATARIGLVARGIVYALVATLLIAAAIAPGSADKGYSPGDTFRNLETQPAGLTILGLIATGLFLYAIWRTLQAVLDTASEGHKVKAILARIGMMTSGLSYLSVGIAAALTLIGRNEDKGGGGTTEQFSAWLLGQAFGRHLLMVFGLIVLATGIIQVWRGVTRKWASGINLPDASSMSCRFITCAIAGRGFLICLIGCFVIWAGFVGQAEEAKGLSSLLGWLRDQPFGLLLYVTSALIIAIYGYYSLVQARYLRISLDG